MDWYPWGPEALERARAEDKHGIYMDAVQAMTGQGGWPMTVFLTPEARPGIEGEIVERARAFVGPLDSWRGVGSSAWPWVLPAAGRRPAAGDSRYWT